MTQKNTEERKQIEKRLVTLGAERETKRLAYVKAREELSSVDDEIEVLQRRLQSLKPKAITVSDHAIVRYLERQVGVDIEAIRKSILESDLPTMVNALGGSGKFPINGYQVVLKDYTVVTISA